MLTLLFFLAFYLFVLPANVHAYLDPGTGSYLTQIAIGFLLGGAYVLKRYFRQVKSFIQTIFRKVPKEEDEPED